MTPIRSPPQPPSHRSPKRRAEMKRRHPPPPAARVPGTFPPPGVDRWADPRAQPLPARAEQPQDVHVAGWVVAEVVSLVELTGPVGSQALCPGREVADIDSEAGEGSGDRTGE